MTFRLVEHVSFAMARVMEALEDQSALVRMTALTCISQLTALDINLASDGVCCSQVKQMILSDRDATVVGYAVLVLYELVHDQPILASTEFSHRIFSILFPMDSWMQCQMLGKLQDYEPADQNEVLDIMNALDALFSASDSAVIVALSKLFLEYNAENKDLELSIVLRTLSSLFTANYSVENLTTFQHIKTMVSLEPVIVRGHRQHFEYLATDDVELQCCKIDIINVVADESTSADIISSLARYFESDYDQAVRSAAFKMIQLTRSFEKHVWLVTKLLIDHLLNGYSGVLEALIKLALENNKVLAIMAPRLVNIVRSCMTDSGHLETYMFFVALISDKIPDAKRILRYLAQNFTESLIVTAESFGLAVSIAGISENATLAKEQMVILFDCECLTVL